MSDLLTSDERELFSAIEDALKAEVTPELVRKVFMKEESRAGVYSLISSLGIADSFADEKVASARLLARCAELCGELLLPVHLIPHLLAQGRGVSVVVVAPRDGGALSFVPLYEGGSNVLVITGERALLYRQASPAVEALDRTLPWQSLAGATSEGAPLTLETRERLTAIDAVSIAATIAGCARRAVTMTKEYVAVRKQYGVAIGTFQAVRHRLADMYLASEAITATARTAAHLIDTDPAQASFAANAALRYATMRGPGVIEGAIQLHGGIGFTWEHDLHLYLRRVMMLVAISGGGSLAHAEALLAGAQRQ